MKKSLILISSVAVLALSLSACNTGANGNPIDKQETKTFATGKEGKDAQVLPAWIPDTATDIKEVIRTTGSERIITMQNAPLPSNCTLAPAGQQAKPGDDVESQFKAADYSADPASLSADWWPVGTEQKATANCGKWLLTIDGNTTYAFSPELNVIKDKISKEAKK